MANNQKEYWSNLWRQAFQPPDRVWIKEPDDYWELVRTTVTLPEYIEQHAKHRMKRMYGKYYRRVEPQDEP
jgi:hypothetical protein